jgi:hypothetical protein
LIFFKINVIYRSVNKGLNLLFNWGLVRKNIAFFALYRNEDAYIIAIKNEEHDKIKERRL